MSAKKDMAKEKKETKNRTLFYRRVVWHNEHSDDLENILKLAHARLTTTGERTFPYTGVEIQGMKIKHEAKNGLYCHVASYIPGQSTSLVPTPSTSEENDPFPQAPPNKFNYMEGDVFFLVRGDHIVLCPSGVRESIAISYISNILQNSYDEDAIPKYSIEPIADVNKIKLLQQEGVKKIIMNASLYDASIQYMERKTFKETMLSKTAEEIKAFFSLDDDEELRDIDKKENLTVRLEISYDSRKKGGYIGKKRIDSAANKLLKEDEEDGFLIITGTGKQITSHEVRLSEKAQIEIHGKSVSRIDAWYELKQYLNRLINTGMLEQ